MGLVSQLLYTALFFINSFTGLYNTTADSNIQYNSVQKSADSNIKYSSVQESADSYSITLMIIYCAYVH